jgi:predicted nuclease of predicted toxin-antitoxin system
LGKLKQQSHISQPDPVFFVDRNLGAEQLPTALREAGFCLVVHDEHFNKRQNVDDPEVISECGRNEWFLLTADSDLTRRWAKEIRSARIGVFCQTNNNQGPRLWIPRIIKGKSGLLRAAFTWEKPFIAFIQGVPKGILRRGELR